MLAIYKKEIRSYFTTPIGFVFVGVFLAASGLLFGISTLESKTSSLSTYMMFLTFAFIVLLPLLTMKSFAEEKRTKTEQLLLTAPISITSMVLAKFFAALTIFLATLTITCFYAIPLAIYGNPNIASFFGCIIALAFIGTCFIAIGIFISSITENQFSAATVTIAILAFLMLISLLNSLIDSYFVRTVLNWISIYSRYTYFTYGIFDYSATLYYLSICVVFLFLTVRVFERRRWN